ncbi:lipopolysaccharide biosynthesis protein [Psychromonas hadalis]|uniref:lipopolysaccharide biosynthesis protein n=1 Tax=Psychromonas hadalis TaxID=211669 RepID=UPI0003B56A06|nr:oligosaccharide flippase family protein [Psychromonas hadalis]
MKFKIKNSIKQSCLYGASIALMKGVSLLLLPFIAHHLSANEFGRLEVISTLAIIGSIIVGMGLEDTLFRFAGPAKNKQQQRLITSEIFTLTLFIGLLALFFAWFIATGLSKFIPGQPSIYEVRLVLLMLALEGCIAIPLGWLRMQNKAGFFFFISSGRALLQALLVATFLFFDRGVAGILEAGLIAATLQALILGSWQIKDTGLHFSRTTSYRSLIYSLPIVGSGIVAFVLNGLDRWVLADYTSLIDVAVFSIAAKFALATVLLLQPFGMWWSPRRFEVLKGINGKQQVAKVIAMGSCLALSIAVFVALVSPTLIILLLPDNYHQASLYVVALVFIMLLKELVELFNIGCFHGNTTNSQLLINIIGASIGLLIMFWLTPLYQVWGLISALLIAQSVRLLLFYNISQYYLTLNYPIFSLLIFTLIGALWIFVGTQIEGLFSLLLIVIASMVNMLFSAHYLNLFRLPYYARASVTL